MTVVVRTAETQDYPAVTALTVEVYREFVSPSYLDIVANTVGRAEHAEILVADDDGEILGAVTLAAHGGLYAERAEPDDAVFRMLAVSHEARGRGVGEALVRACMTRATAAGRTRMIISTQDEMTAAQRLYQRMGFVFGPDWSPEPDVVLHSLSRSLP